MSTDGWTSSSSCNLISCCGNVQPHPGFGAARGRIRVCRRALGEFDDNRLTGLYRRFEVVPGGQGQVDWGDEGGLLGHVGVGKV